jgi:cytochrome b561
MTDRPKSTATGAGIPVASDEVGPDGPILSQDQYLIEQIANLSRERIPERQPYAGTTPQDGKMAGEVKCDRHYGRVAIGLHWVSAMTILTLWLIGQFNGFLPRGPLRLGIWSAHVLLGLVLALVVAVRIYWRLRHPPGETQDRGLLYAFAELGHLALYGLMPTVIALGLANAFLRGFSMFGVWSLPKLPASPDLAQSIDGWHALTANTLVVVALMHAAAAMFHHFVLRDGVLGHMLPALWPRDAAAHCHTDFRLRRSRSHAVQPICLLN